MNYLLATSILMASIVEQKDGDKKFPNPIIGKTPFLSSVRDFAPEGVKLGVERVSKLFSVDGVASVTVEFMLMSDMEKCRCYELDGEGDYVLTKDELTGKEEKKLVLKEIKEEECITFPMFFKCGKPKEVSNEAQLIFYPTSSAYPLFKLALQEAGELPEDMGDKASANTQEEHKEALEGFIFIGKCEEIKGKYNYMRLQAESE